MCHANKHDIENTIDNFLYKSAKILLLSRRFILFSENNLQQNDRLLPFFGVTYKVKKNCFASQQVSHDTRQGKILFPVLLDLKHTNKI